MNTETITVDELVKIIYNGEGGGPMTLNDLTNVDTTGAVVGQVLKLASDGQWKPATDQTGGGGGGTGAEIYAGTTVPATGLGVDGDGYLRSTGDWYRKETGAWSLKFNLKGPQGDPGSTGSQGPKGDTGLQGPKGDTGLQGPKGDTGNTGNTGAAGKSAYQSWLDAGNTGTEAQFLASLKGVQGDAGAKGDTGLQGPKGDKGDTGNTGNTGATGRSIQVFTSVPSGSFGTNYFAGDVVIL